MHVALPRTLFLLHTSLSAIFCPFRQVLRYAKSRVHSGVEIEWSRLHCFRQHRSISNRRWGTWPPFASYPRCPISWVLSPFPLEYTRTHNPTFYMSRCLPQLGSRSLHIQCACPSFTWTVTKGSCRRRIRIERSWGWRGSSIWSKRTLSNSHSHFQTKTKSLSLLA